MVCPKCGKEVGDARFCTGCGYVMGSAQSQQSAPVAPAAPVNQVNFNTPAPAAQPPQKDNKKTIIIAVAAVVIVLIIAIAAVVIFMTSKSKDDDDDKDTKTKTEEVIEEDEEEDEEEEEYEYEDEEEEYDYNDDYDYYYGYENTATDEDFTTAVDWYYDGVDTIGFIRITNNKWDESALAIYAVAYDDDGNEIGTDYTYVEALGTDETTVAFLYFEGVSGVTSIGWDTTFELTGGDSSCISYISYEYTPNEEDGYFNVDIDVTNNSQDKDFEYAEVYVLFYDEDNNLIGYDCTYADDEDGYLNAGETVSISLDYYGDVGSYEIYVYGT